MRTCGECQACCTSLAVDELRKPPGKTCEHLCEKGCGVYELRPQSCAGFYCLWLESSEDHPVFPEWMRPDRSGVMLVPIEMPDGTSAIAAHVLHDDLRSSTAKRLEMIASLGIPVIKCQAEKRQLIWLRKAH